MDVAWSDSEVVGKHGYTLKITKSLKELTAEDYDALILPGGRAPEKVRLNEDAVRLTKDIFNDGKPVATICHGVQILISAGVLKGRTGTCYPGIKDDMINAGAHWVDAAVHVDKNWVSSRVPDDLPQMMKAFLGILQQ